jgi:hypothetical protein
MSGREALRLCISELPYASLGSEISLCTGFSLVGTNLGLYSELGL